MDIIMHTSETRVLVSNETPAPHDITLDLGTIAHSGESLCLERRQGQSSRMWKRLFDASQLGHRMTQTSPGSRILLSPVFTPFITQPFIVLNCSFHSIRSTPFSLTQSHFALH